MKDRPAGITLLAIGYIALGLLSLLWSGLVFGVGGLTSLFGGLFGAESIAAFGASSSWTGFLGIVAAIFEVIVAFGLLGMKRWAWYLAVVGVGIAVLQGILGLFSGGVFGMLCGVLWLTIPILILVYLLSAGTRRVFAV